ncbi:MAG: hypothetical protein AAFV07_12270 [Bacteroidota bacterium]
MKRIHSICLCMGAVLLSILTACTNVYFTEPAPVSWATEAEIPAFLQGRYVEKTDTLWVEATGYRMTEDQVYRYSPGEREDSIEIRNGLAFARNGRFKWGHPYKEVADTIWVNVHRQIFEALDADLVCKSSGELVFLSERQTEGWVVMLAQKEAEGHLVIRMIDDEKEAGLLKKFFDLTPLGEQTGQATADRSKKVLVNTKTADLIKYLKAGGFTEEVFRLPPG